MVNVVRFARSAFRSGGAREELLSRGRSGGTCQVRQYQVSLGQPPAEAPIRCTERRQRPRLNRVPSAGVEG
jgi:hypothetical protein